MIFAFAFSDGQVVDAGETALHEALLVEFPILIAVGAEPVAGVIVPFIGETHGDAVAVKGPEFLDETIIQFPIPLPREKLDDGLAAGQEFGTIAPDAIG